MRDIKRGHHTVIMGLSSRERERGRGREREWEVESVRVREEEKARVKKGKFEQSQQASNIAQRVLFLQCC